MRRVDPGDPVVRRRMARVLRALAAATLTVAVLAVVIGWITVGALDRNSRRSIEVTIASLDSIEQTVATADTVLRSATASLDAAGAALAELDRSFAATTELGGGVAELADTLAPALEDTTAALRRLERVGGEIDAVLAGLSALPLAPDYTPSAGLGPTFGAIATDLDPVPGALRDTADQLATWQRSTGALQQDLHEVAATVAELDARVADSAALIGRYRTNIADARAAAEAAGDDLRANAVVVRLLLVLAGAVFAALAVVPWWTGAQLAAELEADDDPARVV